jgi:hypothetical protein
MITILKLLTGEEIIGDVDFKDGKVKISKPCILQIVSTKNDDQPMMALVPYAPYTEDHCITVEIESVIWHEKPIKEIYNQYNKIFGTGIVV